MPGKRHSGGDMVEHEELVGEILTVEKMSTAERLKHAKKRRQHQLKKYSQYEKQLDKESNKKTKKGQQNKKIKRAGHNRRVEFVSNVMLLEAAARNDIEEVKNLLKGKVNPDVTNEDGLTALHQCCIDDLEEMLRLLLEYGANVNAQDSELWTPLHAAATCGHIHLCKILIDHGAELLSVNADGNMPYDICEDEVTLDFIENEMAKRGVTQEQIDETRLSSENQMLKDLKAYADGGGDLVEYTGRISETLLHVAAANGYLQVTDFLISKLVPVNVRDGDSWQPIHAAACWGHLPVLELLVQNGADLDAKTKNGETPYDICEDIEIRERLMELKSEMAAKGQIKSRNLVRRRSTNTRSPKPSPRGVPNTQSSVVSNSSASIYSSNTSLVDKNPISASVRRVSSKDKGAIAHKEAMEEAGRLRESVSDKEDNEDAEEDVQNGLSEEAPRKVEDVHVVLPDKGFSSQPAQSTTKPESPPSKPAAKPAAKPQPPKADQKAAVSPKMVVIPKKSAPDKPSRVQPSQPADGASSGGSQQPTKDPVPEILNTRVTKPPQGGGGGAKVKEVTGALKQQKESANKKSTSDTKPGVVGVKKETVVHEETKKSHNKGAPKGPGVGVAAAAAVSVSKPDVKQPQQQQRSAAAGKENIIPTGTTDNKQQGQTIPVAREPSKDSTSQVDHKPGHARPSTESSSKNNTTQQPTPASPKHHPHHERHSPYESSAHPPQSSNTSTPHMSSPPQGTLSDLKKQRAQKLQEKLHESMRFKDGDALSQEISNHNANYHQSTTDPTHAATTTTAPAQQPQPQQPPQPQQFTNGHNGKVLQQPAGNNNSYPARGGGGGSGGDSMKKYKYSDTTSVLGDSDTQTSCCVLQ